MTDTLKVQNNSKVTFKSLNDSLSNNPKDTQAEIQINNKNEKIFDLITYDTAFTVIVTVSIFILGILADRTVKYFDKRKERKRLRKFYVDNIYSLTEKLFPNISKLYKDFYQTHDIDTGIPMTPPKVLARDVERLDKIEFDKLYEAFSSKKTLSIVMSQLDFISKAVTELEIYHDRVHADNQRARTSYQEKLNMYLDLLADYLKYDRVNNSGHATDSTYILINASLLMFHQTIAGKRELRRFYKEILRPIQIELVNTRKFETHPVGEPIAKLGKDLSHKFNELNIQSIEIRLQYRYIYRQIQTSIDKLNEVKFDLR